MMLITIIFNFLNNSGTNKKSIENNIYFIIVVGRHLDISCQCVSDIILCVASCYCFLQGAVMHKMHAAELSSLT